MPFSINNESKNSISLNNESKFSTNSLTWDDAIFSWDNAGDSTWDAQFLAIGNESKNSISITNESKNA